MDFDRIDLEWRHMLDGINAQVAFVRHSPHAIYRDIQAKLNLERVPPRVYLTGCGDSWYCGMAARFAFEEWAGIPTEAPQALEFSRYLVGYAPKDSLVLAVSNSGRVARTIECVVQANRFGLTTVAATSNLSEGISQEAQHTIDLAYSERRFAPGTSSYMASLVVQYCLALSLAALGGRLSPEEVHHKLDQISALADPMQETIERSHPVLESLACRIDLKTAKIVFLGAGPNYGTAFFSMAKIIESLRHPAVGQELEEWAHEQFFTTDENTITFIIAPPGASLDRAREQAYAVKAMGSTCVMICAGDDHETATLADVVLPVAGAACEILSPILYCIPAELFAYHLALANNTRMFGFDNPKIKEVNFRQIFESRIRRD